MRIHDTDDSDDPVPFIETKTVMDNTTNDPTENYSYSSRLPLAMGRIANQATKTATLLTDAADNNNNNVTMIYGNTTNDTVVTPNIL